MFTFLNVQELLSKVSCKFDYQNRIQRLTSHFTLLEYGVNKIMDTKG